MRSFEPLECSVGVAAERLKRKDNDPERGRLATEILTQKRSRNLTLESSRPTLFGVVNDAADPIRRLSTFPRES